MSSNASPSGYLTCPTAGGAPSSARPPVLYLQVISVSLVAQTRQTSSRGRSSWFTFYSLRSVVGTCLTSGGGRLHLSKSNFADRNAFSERHLRPNVKLQRQTPLRRHGRRACCPAVLQPRSVCRGRLIQRKHPCRDTSVPGAREKASREETPPQTQPETQVRVSGDSGQRDIRQSEESQRKIRQTGKLVSILLFFCKINKSLAKILDHQVRSGQFQASVCSTSSHSHLLFRDGGLFLEAACLPSGSLHFNFSFT